MIVKTTRWKNNNFGKLISYIARDKKRYDKSGFTIFHNIKNSEINGAIKEFKDNDLYRKKRKRGVVIYHEVLSFHQKDRSNLNMEILEDFARRYIEIRGQNALCYAKPHIFDKNIHIHFCFSGTEYKSSKVLRMGNKAFKKCKRKIERYQIETYPELRHSIVYTKEHRKVKRKKSDKEYQLKKRTKNRKTDKEIVQEILQECCSGVEDFTQFLDNVRKRNLEIYQYRTRFNGVLYKGRKYRFKRFGIDQKYFEDIAKRKLELDNLNFSENKKKKVYMQFNR